VEIMPRPLVRSGLPGIGQDIFPESAKQLARNIGFKSEYVTILRNTPKDDGGGDTIPDWKPVSKVDGRIDALSRRGQGQVIAEQVNEATTHVVSMDPDAEVTTTDRLEVAGTVWIIMSKEIHTDQPTVRVQVRELEG
jgi:hypothetical protein